jgi:hypothetical protein
VAPAAPLRLAACCSTARGSQVCRGGGIVSGLK